MKKAEAAVDKAKDHLERLHALANLENNRHVDGDQLRTDFINYADTYAEEQSVPASAFREMGVPADVLAAAGASRSRVPRVLLEQVKAAVDRLPKRFTLADLGQTAGGGSTATLRKAATS